MSRLAAATMMALYTAFLTIPVTHVVAAPIATYWAEWDGKEIAVVAMGTNPTSGWKNELLANPTTVPPYTFRFTQTKPMGISLAVVTPFLVCIEVPAAMQPDKVVIVDSDGPHDVAVGDPGQFPHMIPCDARSILYSSKTLKLLSLDPNPPGENSKDNFHGWKVLGSKDITDEKVKQELAQAFEVGVLGYHGGAAHCFNPRHGIRAEHGGKVADFVICFECFQVRSYVTDRKEKWFMISRLPQELFDRMLKESRVPLPKD